MPQVWFRNAMEYARRIRSSESQDFIVAELGLENGIEELPREIKHDSEYVTVRLRSARIVDVRQWSTTFYGTIHSCVQFLHEDRGPIAFNAVIAPEKMRELDPKNADRLIQVDKPVAGPFPYRGEVSVELGLFSVKGSDLAAPYLELLGGLAEQSGIAAVSTAMQYATTLQKGIELLFGNQNQTRLEIGIDRSWRDLMTGTWTVMRAEKAVVDMAGLMFDPADGRLLHGDGRPFGRYSYFVFTIEASGRRDDWMTIPELKNSWDAVQKAVRERQVNDAEQLFRQFVLTTRVSPDLVPADVERLIAKAKARVDLIQPDMTMSQVEGEPEFPAFSDLDLYDDSH